MDYKADKFSIPEVLISCDQVNSANAPNLMVNIREKMPADILVMNNYAVNYSHRNSSIKPQLIKREHIGQRGLLPCIAIFICKLL